MFFVKVIIIILLSFYSLINKEIVTVTSMRSKFGCIIIVVNLRFTEGYLRFTSTSQVANYLDN